MNSKIDKLESDIAGQKKRDSKLKMLHSDELKYIKDMNSIEINLHDSKIKQLESTISHLQKKLQRCSVGNETISGISGVSNIDDAGRYDTQPFGALTEAAANLGGSTSRLHSSALRGEA